MQFESEEAIKIRNASRQDDLIESKDSKSLFERIKEQIKSEEEAWKDANKVTIGLDEDDSNYLNEVEKNKYLNQLELKQNDMKEIELFRKKSLELSEEDLKRQRQAQISTHEIKKRNPNSQKNLLLRGIKRKAQASSLKCIAVLPGIGNYGDKSSESESSTDTSDIECESMNIQEIIKRHKTNVNNNNDDE